MSLRFHNQLTKKIEPFTPLTKGRVLLYTCGPTVYDRLHIGNWTAYIYWDVLVRILKAHNLNVTRVMNITDVGHLVSDGDEGEDKLEKGARREGKTAWDIAELYTNDFLDGMQQLNLLPPEHTAKATEFIEEQLQLVRTLKEKGFTYQTSDGIYFDTSKFPRYDDFADLHLEAQKAGARVEANPEKRAPSDFALWKFTPEGETRDMQWPTPVDLLDEETERPGFPGWHLECSAMVMSLLGNTIDIHTGGIDHIPVHHTNEIAQSEAATGQRLSNFWLHNNHIKAGGTKISKSLENGLTLEDLAKKGFHPLDLRLFTLQSHYRTEGNFTFENLAAAQHRRLRWRNIAAIRHQIHDTLQEHEGDDTYGLYAASQALVEELSDDINTPGAFRLIDEVFGKLESARLGTIHRHSLVSFLTTIDELLGLQLLESSKDIADEPKRLIIERERARESKDWPASDTLRIQIEKSGVSIRDTADGTIWEYTN